MSFFARRTGSDYFSIFQGREEVLSDLTFDEACQGVARLSAGVSLDTVIYDLVGYDEGQAEAEAYAEFGMSWIHGGGSREDVSAAWAMYGGK